MKEMSPSHRWRCNLVGGARLTLGGLYGESHGSVRNPRLASSPEKDVVAHSNFTEPHVAAFGAEVLHAVQCQLTKVSRIFTATRH